MDQAARHIIFRGRVQGVGFRYTASSMARRYGVTGFVRNLPDGAVEMLAQGDPQDIDNCIEDIQDAFTGHIRDTEVEPIPHNPRYTDFEIAF